MQTDDSSGASKKSLGELERPIKLLSQVFDDEGTDNHDGRAVRVNACRFMVSPGFRRWSNEDRLGNSMDAMLRARLVAQCLRGRCRQTDSAFAKREIVAFRSAKGIDRFYIGS